jgi:ABC-type glycerol-3-phosphate transport system substrate-binding protein
MNTTTSRFGLAFGMALIAGTAMLAGCGGPSPVTTRTSTTEQTTTMPRPAVSTTTTTTQQTQRP